MSKSFSVMARRVVLIWWKDRTDDPLEVFSNLKIFSASYPEYSYHTLNNYLSKRKCAFEDDRLRIERKGMITRPVLSGAPTLSGFGMVKVVRKRAMKGSDEAAENLAYWLSRSPEERVAAASFIVSQSLRPGERINKKLVKTIKMKADVTRKGF